LRDNRLRVELGTLAPIDVLESEAEVASRHQAVTQAEGAWRAAQTSELRAQLDYRLALVGFDVSQQAP
jgi:hypothetical protein